MNLDQAKQVLFRTHLAALERGERASGYVLESPPGVGKSDGVFQYAQMVGHQTNQPVGVVQFMLTTITSPDVRGFMLPLKTEPGKPLQTVFSVPPWYPTHNNAWVYDPAHGSWHEPGIWAGEVPRIGVLFLDEWGQAEEDVKKPAAELILHGRVGTTFLPAGWRVAAAQNRMSDRSGVMREMMFIVNRRGLLTIEPNLATWVKWTDALPQEVRPHYMTITFARKNPDIAFRNAVPDAPDPFCTPRSLCLMDREVRSLGPQEEVDKDQFPMGELAREVCAGWIGQGAAGQFYAHLKYAEQLPDFEDIVTDPMHAKLPDGRDAQMIVAYMTAQHVDEDNAKNVMRYISRLIQEMQILAVHTISADPKRRKFLVPVREYNNWLSVNKDRLIASQS